MAQPVGLVQSNPTGSTSRRKQARVFYLVAILALVVFFSNIRNLWKYKCNGNSVVEPPGSKDRRSPTCTAAISDIAARRQHAKVVIDSYNIRNCSEAKNETGVGRRIQGCSFADFGQELLLASAKSNKTLLTVQIGGMDGKSNDPMYAMFANKEKEILSHWLPVVFEPVQANFVNLDKTYADLAQRGLSCPLLNKRAITYGSPNKTCTFCEFDTSEDAPELCKTKPDWMKHQIGTLQCDWSQTFFQDHYQKCVKQVPVDCGPVEEALQNLWGVSPRDIAMLQIDIEGLEHVVISGMLEALPPRSFPLLIHFEEIVLKRRDQKVGQDNLESLLSLLRNKGYLLFDDGEDMLAVLL